MAYALKLISLNIEGSRHLELVLPFLKRQMPDVATLQEVNERDVPRVSQALGGADYYFIPMSRLLRDGTFSVFGVGIFSRVRMAGENACYYDGNSASIPDSDFAKTDTYNNNNRVLAICDIEKGGATFRISTTHFTWSKDGQPSDPQKTDMRKLLAILESSGEFVLTGDFNAPRGGEVFSMLADKYKDNVPSHYTTSIDGNLHRAGQLNLMVDGIFSTPGYEVSNVQMVSGLSDHGALVATVSKIGG